MAARLNRRHQDMVREKIRASQLINTLEKHIQGENSLSLSQVMAIDGLLKKIISDWPEEDGVPVSGFGNSGVYIIEAIGSGRYKIGYSINVTKRLAELQTGCPFEARILNVIDSDKQGETWLHAKYAQYRVSGEWFELPARIAQVSVQPVRKYGH